MFDNLLEKGVFTGVVTKIVDNLYCGWNTPKNLQNRQKVLQAVHKCDLYLSVLKTVINPQTITNLGWVWKSGTSQASSHHFGTITSCPEPDTVGQMRFFIGAFKVLVYIIPGCSSLLTPHLDTLGGHIFKEAINCMDKHYTTFHNT